MNREPHFPKTLALIATLLSDAADELHADMNRLDEQALRDELADIRYSNPGCTEADLPCGCRWRLIVKDDEGDSYTEHEWRLCEAHEDLEP